MEKKIDILSRMMKGGEWEKAIKYAAKFPRLDNHKKAILTASSAILNPGFYKQIGKDPSLIIDVAILALKERYPNHY
jgi:hypothetical protein